MSKTSTTLPTFLLLFTATVLIEGVGGWLLCVWYYQTTWYAPGDPSSVPLAVIIATRDSTLSQALSVLGNAPHRVELHWTAAGVVRFFLLLSLGVHLCFAVGNGLLAPWWKR